MEKHLVICIGRQFGSGGREIGLGLAKKLGIHTVAEGIETPDQVEYLRGIHCDMVQGYVFSKPLPIPEFMARYLS